MSEATLAPYGIYIVWGVGEVGPYEFPPFGRKFGPLTLNSEVTRFGRPLFISFLWSEMRAEKELGKNVFDIFRG